MAEIKDDFNVGSFYVYNGGFGPKGINFMSKNMNSMLSHWRKISRQCQKDFSICTGHPAEKPQRAFEMICHHNIFISTLGFLNQLKAVRNIQNPVTNVQAMQR